MSADNFLVVDHDGQQYLLYEGFASDEERPFPEGLSLQGKFHTKAEVDTVIADWSIIEYGLSFTDRANLALATEIMGEPRPIIDLTALSELVGRLEEIWKTIQRLAAERDTLRERVAELEKT